ncbi:hypothetical protein, partial [Streptomyces sp. NPDC051636]|uniref:hypothetical protein n=1 Tax=Streptomyces sp. NPDC051636 TaxID=3365663 RepID=UPI0037B51294
MSTLSPEALVTLGDIIDHQHLRTSRIASVLGNRLGSSALDYAVAHHLLEGAEQAARSRDADRLAWYRNTTSQDLTHLSAGSHIILNPRPGDLLRSEISETAYYLGGFVWIIGRTRGRCRRCGVRRGRWSRSCRS